MKQDNKQNNRMLRDFLGKDSGIFILDFDTSLDTLMVVVDAIRKTKIFGEYPEVHLGVDSCYITWHPDYRDWNIHEASSKKNGMIHATYNACVRFVSLYNKILKSAKGMNEMLGFVDADLIYKNIKAK